MQTRSQSNGTALHPGNFPFEVAMFRGNAPRMVLEIEFLAAELAEQVMRSPVLPIEHEVVANCSSVVLH